VNLWLKEHYDRLRAGEKPRPQGEFGRVDNRAVLVFPNSYHVGMSNLGFQTIYGLVNSVKGFLCDRFFPDDWTSDAPPLSLECERPLADFDVLAFSVAFENDYLNVLKTLDMARLPLRSADRDGSHPLVVLGGAVTFLNPEPIADFVDVILIGEGEETAPKLFDVMRRMKPKPRGDQLREAAGLEGVYVPALTSVVPFGPCEAFSGRGGKRRIPEGGISHSCIIAADTEFSGTFLVEISRGCPYGCRFCAVGHTYPHFRWASADDVLWVVDRALGSRAKEPPFTRVGLVSSAVGEHPGLDELCLGLRERGLGVTVSSLRVDRLSDLLLDCLAASGTRTVAIAPEAGSKRLRMAAKKDISEEAILDGAARVTAHGIPNVRLYFIVGLPTETEDDVDALIKLAIKVRKAMDEGARGGAPAGVLTVSVAPFVPKPRTPLQWSAMEGLRAVKRKLSIVRRALHGVRGIRVRSESLKAAYLQGILSRGGREMSGFLEETHLLGGDWRGAVGSSGLDLGDCLGPRRLDEKLPWDSMYNEGQIEALALEYRRAHAYVKE
jgi:radical SAM superfamily enzyme YgiQ (UPF0313 family)